MFSSENSTEPDSLLLLPAPHLDARSYNTFVSSCCLGSQDTSEEQRHLTNLFLFDFVAPVLNVDLDESNFPRN